MLLHGFGNHFSTEALPGALPLAQNSPQKPKYGLYPEQISGSAFTAPRAENLRSWVYRIRPSVVHGVFQPMKNEASGKIRTSGSTADPNATPANPNQMRWDPMPYPDTPTDFIDGWSTWMVNGDAMAQSGCGVHLYACNQSMSDRFFYCADGELLIVPQEGALRLHTEMGALLVAPLEIAVIPRGIKFQVALADARARGYICENYGKPFRLPGLGPIGSNGLANPRDFMAPSAAFTDQSGSYTLVAKFAGSLWSCPLKHHPLDVVAWHGNYTPYKYDLRKFNTIGTVSFDHPDPSIFTVLTSPSDTEGMANVDFVIFPPRWMVAENTFRPPYYHRNIMSEFMGLIQGIYDAKPDGFVPGGSSLHNCFSAHGPDAATFDAASNAALKPVKQDGTMAFMFESRYLFKPTRTALETPLLQKKYLDCWQGLAKHFQR